MGRRVGTLAGVVLAIAALVAGCGDEGSDTTATPAAKAAFIAKVDAICQQGNKRMEQAFTAYLKENEDIKRPSKADFEALVGEAVVPNLRREVKEIRALEAPSGEDEERIDAIVDALEDGIETAEDNPETAANSGEAVFGISSRLAKEYGLQVCSTR